VDRDRRRGDRALGTLGRVIEPGRHCQPLPICTIREPDLEVIIEFSAAKGLKGGSPAHGCIRDDRRRLESFVARKTLVHARKVDIPRGVNRLGILLPMPVHLLHIIRIRTVCERIVGGRRLGSWGGQMTDGGGSDASDMLCSLRCARQAFEGLTEHLWRRRRWGRRGRRCWQRVVVTETHVVPQPDRRHPTPPPAHGSPVVAFPVSLEVTPVSAPGPCSSIRD
jgi:hypothetical protein